MHSHSRQASLTAGVYIFRDPTTGHQSPSEVILAETFCREALNATSDTILNHAAAVAADRKHQTDILRGNSGAMKAMAAARKALRAAQNALDTAEPMVGRHKLTDQRQTVDGLAMTLTSQAPSFSSITNQGLEVVAGQVDIARHAAEAIRETVHVLKVVPDAGKSGGSDSYVEQQYLDALDAAGDASRHHAEIVAMTYNEHASDAHAAMLRAILSAHRTIHLALSTVDAVREPIGYAMAKDYRGRLVDAKKTLATHTPVHSTPGPETEIQDAIATASVALQVARQAADTARVVVSLAQSNLRLQ